MDISKDLLPLARAAQALADLVEYSKTVKGQEQTEREHKARLAAITEEAQSPLITKHECCERHARAGSQKVAQVLDISMC